MEAPRFGLDSGEHDMVIASDNAPRCPLPMPWGWFQVLYSHDLAVGESKPALF